MKENRDGSAQEQIPAGHNLLDFLHLSVPFIVLRAVGIVTEQPQMPVVRHKADEVILFFRLLRPCRLAVSRRTDHQV